MRIRGGSPNETHEPYPLNEFPDSLIQQIAQHIVYLLAVGRGDITGDEFDNAFSDSIGGTSFNKPLGVADMGLGRCAWSVKTVKAKAPHNTSAVRLISGRCNPNYSVGITDPTRDIQATGHAVLDIYNERINEAVRKYAQLRLAVFIRNMGTLEFTIYERILHPVAVNNYRWNMNDRDNFEGRETATNNHAFTWQPHGSQLTVMERVPPSALRFRLRHRPSRLELQHVLDLVKYDKDWLEILPPVNRSSS